MITLLALLTLTMLIGLVFLFSWLVYHSQITKKSVNVDATLNTKIEKQAPNARQFIFDVTVVDPVAFVSRPLRAKITVQNIDEFLNPPPINSVSTQRSYISPVDDKILHNMHINFVGTTKDTNTFNPEDELGQHFYEIKNKYFLLDPFLTSGKEMIITDKMTSAFAKIVDEKSKSIDIQYQNYKRDQLKNNKVSS